MRQEPYEVIPQVRICAGGAGQPAFLPQPIFIRYVVTNKEMKNKSETLSNTLLNHDSFKLAEKYISEDFMN